MSNEKELDQELEQNLEEGQEETQDQKDLEAELAKYKAIADRKSKQLEKLKEGLDEEPNKSKETTTETEAQRLERLELKVDGYNDKEIDFILKNGGREAVSDEMVNAAIEAARAKAKAEDATPEGAGKSPIFKRFTQDDVNNMSLDQLEEIVPKTPQG